MWIILRIVAAIFLLYALVARVRVTASMLEGCFAIRKLEDNLQKRIFCKNLLYRKRVHIMALVSGTIIMFVDYKFLEYTKILDMVWDSNVFTLLIIVQGVEILENLIALVKDQHAYLTSEGIVSCMGIMRPGNCTYSWEHGSNGMDSQVLLVYKDKEPSPYRFKIEEQHEQAHEMVQLFYGKVINQEMDKEV